MKKCFECEETEDLQEHHIVPRSKGGTKTIMLCYGCHMKAHGRDSRGLNHKRLTEEGLARAKAQGVELGNPRWNESIDNARQAKTSKANAYALSMEHMVMNDHSTRRMASILNDLGLKTRAGKDWTQNSIFNLRKRITELRRKYE